MAINAYAWRGSLVPTTIPGIQVFSPWAEFSPCGTHFGHSWDQCKSVEKIFSIWGGSEHYEQNQLVFAIYFTHSVSLKGQKMHWNTEKASAYHWGLRVASKPPAARAATAATALFRPYCHQPLGTLICNSVPQLRSISTLKMQVSDQVGTCGHRGHS